LIFDEHVFIQLKEKRTVARFYFYKRVGPDSPGETFRVLKEKQEKQFGEYRTRCFEAGVGSGIGNSVWAKPSWHARFLYRAVSEYDLRDSVA
jgi:hypothetical protein